MFVLKSLAVPKAYRLVYKQISESQIQCKQQRTM